MAITRVCIDRFRSNLVQSFTRDSQYVVQGQRVKGQGHRVRNSQHRFTANMSRFVTYFPRESVELPPTTRTRVARGGRNLHALTRKISNKTTNSRGGCHRNFAKRPKTIFSNQTKPKKPSRPTSGAMSFGLRDAMLSQLHVIIKTTVVVGL